MKTRLFTLTLAATLFIVAPLAAQTTAPDSADAKLGHLRNMRAQLVDADSTLAAHIDSLHKEAMKFDGRAIEDGGPAWTAMMRRLKKVEKMLAGLKGIKKQVKDLEKRPSIDALDRVTLNKTAENVLIVTGKTDATWAQHAIDGARKTTKGINDYSATIDEANAQNAELKNRIDEHDNRINDHDDFAKSVHKDKAKKIIFSRRASRAAQNNR